MSGPMADTAKRRPRRQFTDKFKASAGRKSCDLEALAAWQFLQRSDLSHAKDDVSRRRGT